MPFVPHRRSEPGADRRAARMLDREILALAVPALGALVAEPAFLLVDTALVGHLGAEQLAGVGIGAAVLQTAVGLLVFLAYGTTPTVARLLGSGDRAGAIRAGVDGVWLAVAVGALLLLSAPFARQLVSLFGANEAVTDNAASYLGISILGLPAMLIVLAATGLMRGLQDTKTPLVVAVVGFAANALLNVILIYGAGLGVAGSALGTVIAQWGMAAYFLWFTVRQAHRNGVPLRPHPARVGAAAGHGGWLFVRTLSLRVGLLATTVVATQAGTTVLASTQIAFTIFSTLAFALDALAIAGQAMLGRSLGAGDANGARAVTSRLVRWGVVSGAVLGAVVLSGSLVIGRGFSSDEQVLSMLPIALAILAVAQPIAGYVFVLDGVLIGAGDARYLAWTGMVNLGVYLPLLFLAASAGAAHALASIWLAFSFGYLGARAITLGLRVRSERWMVLGAHR